MKEIWNSTLLNPPPNLTYEIKGDRIDATALSRISSEAVSVLNSQQTLQLEAAALSRVLYRTKVKMRFDKGIMYMSKVNRCLLQYLSMDLEAAYNSLKSSNEDVFGIVCAPSKQRLEWVLVRTQGFAQLFCHIMKACESAAYYMMCRMHLGHVWDLALISLALVSRIWTISKYLVLQSCEWYRLLKPYQDILQPIGVPWLPAGYEFPEDLISWLKTPFLTAPVMLRPKKRSRRREIFDLINLDDDGDVVEEYAPLHEDMSKEAVAEADNQMEPDELDSNPTYSKELPETDFSPQIEDIGEPVVSTPLLPLKLMDSDKLRKKPTKKKKKKEKKEEDNEKKKNTELLKDVKCEIFNKTVLFHSNKKRKTTHHDEEMEDGMSVNTLKLSSKKKKKNTEVEREIQAESVTKTVMKSNKLEQDMEEEIFMKTILHPSKEKKNREHEQEVENDILFQTASLPKLPSVKQIKAFKSVHNLKDFLIKEKKGRKNKLEDCATKCLDKLEWHMFERVVKDYVQKLSSNDLIKGGREYKRILKQAKEEILIRIQ